MDYMIPITSLTQVFWWHVGLA